MERLGEFLEHTTETTKRPQMHTAKLGIVTFPLGRVETSHYQKPDN